MTGVDGQPAPTSDRSRLPVTVKHDDATVQVPIALPPQAVTLGQDDPPPVPLLELPPVPTAPPVPVLVSDVPELHPAEIVPAVTAIAKQTDWRFIDSLIDLYCRDGVSSCQKE